MIRSILILSSLLLISNVILAMDASEYINHIRSTASHCVWVEKIGGRETSTVKTIPIRGCYKADSTVGGRSMPTQDLLCQGTVRCTVGEGLNKYDIFFPETNCPGSMYDGKAACGSNIKAAGTFKGGIYDCLVASFSPGVTSVVHDGKGVTIKNKTETRDVGVTR